jgi:hypothetical protein
MMQKPMLGSFVRYTNKGYETGAAPCEVSLAMVTGVDDENTVSLVVFTRFVSRHLQSVRRTVEEEGTEGAKGCWTWPRRGETYAVMD